MQYLLLIYSEESKSIQASDPRYPGLVEEHRALIKETTDKGILLGAEPLEPTSTATTVRVREEKIQTTDGPFAETKEQLAGYYLIECQNLDEAIEYAARIPNARSGSIEIRPLMKIPEPSN
ncbi:YciI family protein [Puniceicoccaceae bacterium K14]|nr:YciI family protein [Puniceicoccaceae bacterium K14]